jgi:4'-phosphopantetheinyl transferase
MAALAREEDRARHATGAWLADVLAAAHGGPTARVRRAQGKPPVVDGAPLHLSVSHGGAWVAVAISALAPIGVDVEPIQGNRDLDEIAHLILAPSEQDVLDRTRPRDRDRTILTAWTRKEAALKVTGDGLLTDPRGVIALSTRAAHPVQVGVPAGGAVTLSCVVFDLAPDDRHLGALAVSHPAPGPITMLDGDALLQQQDRLL